MAQESNFGKKSKTTSFNDVTGDSLTTKTTTDAYRDNWDRIFGKKNKEQSDEELDTSEGGDDGLVLQEGVRNESVDVV